MKNVRITLIALSCLCLLSCSHHEHKEQQQTTTLSQNTVDNKQLNIVVALDLSDRLIKESTPTHSEKDLAVVRTLTKIFKNDMKKRGTYRSKGKIRVVFSPIPKDSNIAALSENLTVDLAENNNPQYKKEVYDTIDSLFVNSLEMIYSQSINESNWIGCDIWRFFKEDIDLYIEQDMRNIIVVVTDGYIYHDNSCIKDVNRYSYLTSNLIASNNLRDEISYKKTIEAKDFGMISTRNDLGDVEVLMLECDPDKPVDYDIMKEVYGKWFNEMGVKRSSIYKSELPVKTKKAIETFIIGNL